MKFKRGLLIISIFIIILFTVGSVWANDMDLNSTDDGTGASHDIEMTNSGEEDSSFSQDLKTQTDDNDVLTQSTGGDVLSAKWIYFDASASSDGDGSQSKPYKYLKSGRITAGSIAYFYDGTYEISQAMSISSPSDGRTCIVGESAQNTIFKSKLSNKFDFTVNSGSYLYLQNITLKSGHISNQGKLVARDCIFKDNKGFSANSAPSLSYVTYDDDYDATCGGVITCDTPKGKTTTLYLYDCQFLNSNASCGGAIALYNSRAWIYDSIFYNSYASKFGGVFYSRNSEININASSFTKNRARYGGVFYFKGHEDEINIYHSSFTDSVASSFGGVMSADRADMWIYNSTFDNYKSSTDAGGAIYVVNSTSVVQKSSFTNGYSYFGGAICSLKTNLTLRTTDFVDNSADYYGGSVFNFYGNIEIIDNTFQNSHSRGGGGICCRLSDSLIVSGNTFRNTTATYGQTMFIDGDSEKVYEYNNAQKDLYNLFCVYTAKLNGEEIYIDSNYITFSVSNNGDYILPLVDETTQPTPNSTYGSLHVSAEGNPSSVVYSNLVQNNKLFFDLVKYSGNFTDEAVYTYLISGAGDIVYSSMQRLSGNQNYTKKDLTQFNFTDIMMYLKYGNIYDIQNYGGVPIFNYTSEAPGNLPSSYDSRDYGYITPVKNQKEGGNCWAFSGISTLEACIKKATGITYDFSEENAKNLMASYSLFGWDMEINDGGNLYMFMAYLTSWFGPIAESTDPYDDYSALSVIYDPPLFHIQNVWVLPDRQDAYDNDLIKRAIMECGAVSISVPDWYGSGHAISLVGWDDDYVGYDVFGKKSTGAWIFKNSYGDQWRDNGFSYLSYQKVIRKAYTFILNGDRGYSTIYQYDYAGVSGYLTESSDVIYCRNVFTALNDEILTAVSTFFYNETDYNLKVYLNGVLKSTQNGHSQMGYYTIPLLSEIQLKEGDEFMVEFKIINAKNKRIAISMNAVNNRMTFVEGKSFVSHDGVHWYDRYEKGYVFCIKAFTRLENRTLVNINVTEFANVRVNEKVSVTITIPEKYVVDDYNHYINGFITVTIDDECYYVLIDHGKANINFTFTREGTYAFSAQYISNLEISNRVMFYFTVGDFVDEKIALTANDVSLYYGNSQRYVALLTKDGVPFSGEYVKIRVNNRIQSVKTNSKGEAVLDLNLPVGTYNVIAEYGNETVLSKFIVKSTISAADARGYYGDIVYGAEFLNLNGNPLSARQVSIMIGNVEYTPVTSSSGAASVDVDLDAGTYNVTVTNLVTGEQKQFRLEIYRQATDCVLTYGQNGNRFVINAEVTPSVEGSYVTFIFNGSFYDAEVINGSATFETGELTQGIYNVTALYYPNENYLVAMDFISFTFVKTNYRLINEFNSYELNCGTPFPICFGVVDDKGSGVAGQSIKITCNDRVFYMQTGANGLVLINISRYAAGNYKFTAEYGSQSIIVTLKMKSSISAFTYSGKYGNFKVSARFVDGNMDVLKGQTVYFSLNNFNTRANTNNQGYATAYFNYCDAGTWTVNVTNPATGESREFTAVIDRASSEITLSKTQNQNVVTFEATLNPLSATGNVIFSISGQKHTVAVKNGKATLTLDNLYAGSYVASAKYVGDGNFYGSESDSIDFTVNTRIIKFIGSNFTGYYGNTFNVTVTENNNPVVNASVKLTTTKTQNVITDSRGVASVRLNNNPGTYSFTFEYGGVSATYKVVIKSTIRASDLSGTCMNQYAYATFYDSNGKFLSNQYVGFSYDSTLYLAMTNNAGVAAFNKNLTAGTHELNAMNFVTGESKYFHITLTKATPMLKLQMITKDGKDTLMARVTYTGATGKITFSCNGKDYPTGISNGVSYLTFSAAGKYTVTAKYSGDDCLKPASSSITVTIPKKEPKVIMSNFNRVYLDSKMFTVRLVDYWGNGMASKKISLDLNDADDFPIEFYTKKTDSKGYVKLDIDQVPGTYYVDVYYDGKYMGHSKVVIKKAKPTLKASNKAFKAKTKTKKYKVSVETKNYYCVNCKVTLKVGGKTYKAKTNKYGKATFKITKLKKKGRYNAIVTLKADHCYKKVTKKVKIRVK